MSFKNCKYKYGGAEIDLISNGNIPSNIATLVEKKTSSSNKIATFELTGLNANDFQGGKVGRILYSLDIVLQSYIKFKRWVLQIVMQVPKRAPNISMFS